MKWLDRQIINILDKLGRKICKQFGYSYSEIKTLHPNDSWYDCAVAYCDIETRNIRIKLKNKSGRFFKIEYLLDSLIHELAHIPMEINAPDHGEEWREQYLKLRKWVTEKLEVELPRGRYL